MGRASWAEGSESLQEPLTGSLARAPSRWGWRSPGQESKLYGMRLDKWTTVRSLGLVLSIMRSL